MSDPSPKDAAGPPAVDAAGPVEASAPTAASQEPEGDEDGADENSNRPLVALAFLVVLAVVGWFLIDSLMDKTKLQDCVMAGRHNCAPIDTAGR